MQKWYETKVEESDVVISSRVRLARNLKKYCFHDKLTDTAANDLVTEILSISEELELDEQTKLVAHQVNKLTDTDKASMVEWHKISPMLAEKKQSTGLLISEDESISIMINEKDHIRIQAISGGLNMMQALSRANQLDDLLSEKIEYAFDDKYGYLTTNSTNVGTGLRASCMLFLPALTMAGKIQQLSDEIGKFGAQIRGIYGDGTKSFGNIYQISNQKTLGCQESEIIENLTQIVKQAIVQERKRREYLLTMNAEDIEDKVFRSYGVLKYAKKLSTVDAMTLLAQLKLGLDTQLLELQEEQNIYKLMMEIQPANLQKIIGKNIGSVERDHYRADYINSKLSELK